MASERLNVDIPGKISEFESAMSEFLIRRVVYRTILRGKGLEFDGYRNFSPDDDAGNIDWKASARTNKLLVKQYTEERNLKIMFVIDVGDNMVFGSQEKLKCEYAAELASALAHLIINSQDKIGFTFFNDKITDPVQPETGTSQFSLFADSLSQTKTYGGDSKIEEVLDFITDYLDESINGIIFISDFIKLNKNLLKKIELIAAKFEIIALMVKDPLDISLPEMSDEMLIEDPVTHEQMIINPKVANKSYEKNASEQEKIVHEMFKKSGIDYLRLTTDKSFVEPLSIFLKERVEKRRHMVAG